jgi:hypothetical protein
MSRPREPPRSHRQGEPQGPAGVFFKSSSPSSSIASVICRVLNEEDRQGLVDLLQRHGEEVQEYLAAINARPVTVTTVVSPTEARRRLGFINGR